MRRSAARSAAGKIVELGASSSSPIKNQNRPRNGIRHSTASATHAPIAIHNDGRMSDGSIENPHGIINSRKYLQMETPWDPRYASGEIPDCAPEPDPGIAAAANTVRSPIASATQIIVENARQFRGTGNKINTSGSAAHSSFANIATRNHIAAIQNRPAIQLRIVSKLNKAASSVPRANTYATGSVIIG